MLAEACEHPEHPEHSFGVQGQFIGRQRKPGVFVDDGAQTWYFGDNARQEDAVAVRNKFSKDTVPENGKVDQKLSHYRGRG